MDTEERRCPICGEAVPPKGRTGPRKTYCTAHCKSLAARPRQLEREAERTAERRADVVRQCPHCGEAFSPAKTMRQMFCSKKCSQAGYQDSASTFCTVDGCDRPHRARGLCSMHYKRDALASGRARPSEWDERRRKNRQKRDAVKFGPGHEKFSRFEVFDRDGWICQLCGDAVDPTIEWPHPMSASLDHRRPLSRGGDHTKSNSQCAHLVCNTRKGAQLANSGARVGAAHSEGATSSHR